MKKNIINFKFVYFSTPWAKTKNFGEGSKSKPGFPKQPDWFIDARGFSNLESGLSKVGFNKNEISGVLGDNWFNFYKRMN